MASLGRRRRQPAALVAGCALAVLACLAPAAHAQRDSARCADSARARDSAMANMPGMMNMPGMEGAEHAMPMPVPMPKDMPPMPGLMGLVPPVGAFLPGEGVNPASVPMVKPSTAVRMSDGDTLDLTAQRVRRTINGHTFVMYGFNGQVPGPMIHVSQHATIVVRFHNRIDLPATVHWHGVRLDNRNDGVPGVTQPPVPPGGEYTYTVRFPDAGVYWYHPHVREDIEQGMGLFGNMLVDSPDSGYYAPVNAERMLMLDDLLINADTLVAFGKTGPDFALMGRVGNVLLVNGEPRWSMHVDSGAVVRFFITNVANARTYNLSFSGAPMKVVAGDVSRFEREERVPSVVIAPAERYVAEVRFPHSGRYALVNAVQAINHYLGEFRPQVDTMGFVEVGSKAAALDLSRQFTTLRTHPDVTRDIAHYRRYFDRAPDKTLTLTIRPGALPLFTVQFMSVDTAYFAPVEWVDGMPMMNWLSSSAQLRWVIRDDATGKENEDIDWHVKRGAVVKLRIVNDPRSFHPMQHPMHLHGQRMLVVARDGVPTRNLVWKDTVIIPVGSAVDLLIDASNPGAWMLHCHIAEHLGSGMMTVLHVDP
ncbi:MAG TPA: multicopper oxidase family protein [Gemmatimonadaceae bacterium]|nr:multicopper oxidase family protein [Gemmatimonadaceae bacterium]